MAVIGLCVGHGFSLFVVVNGRTENLEHSVNALGVVWNRLALIEHDERTIVQVNSEVRVGFTVDQVNVLTIQARFNQQFDDRIGYAVLTEFFTFECGLHYQSFVGGCIVV